MVCLAWSIMRTLHQADQPFLMQGRVMNDGGCKQTVTQGLARGFRQLGEGSTEPKHIPPEKKPHPRSWLVGIDPSQTPFIYINTWGTKGQEPTDHVLQVEAVKPFLALGVIILVYLQ